MQKAEISSVHCQANQTHSRTSTLDGQNQKFSGFTLICKEICLRTYRIRLKDCPACQIEKKDRYLAAKTSLHFSDRAPFSCEKRGEYARSDVNPTWRRPQTYRFVVNLSYLYQFFLHKF